MSTTLPPLGDDDSIVSPLEEIEIHDGHELDLDAERIEAEIVDAEIVDGEIIDEVEIIDDVEVLDDAEIVDDVEVIGDGVVAGNTEATPTATQPTRRDAGQPMLAASLEDDEDYGGRGMLWTAAPAWLISTLVHMALIVGLAFVTFAEKIEIINVLTANPSAEEGPEIDEFVIEDIDPGEVAESEEFSEPVEEITEAIEVVEDVVMEPMEMPSMDVQIEDMMSAMAPPSASLQTLASLSSVSSAVGSRSEDMKKKLLREYGGTQSSEAAVTEALEWFSRHQMPNGGWTFNHAAVCNGSCGDTCKPEYRNDYNAATAMALLPFLGAGQTHQKGNFSRKVDMGLAFLIKNGKPGREMGLPVLDLRDPKGKMYSHGLASIALCEAYAMTGDPKLAAPAQASVNFIIAAQCKDGGWRYTPRQANGGDTSVVGWQLMALKSAHMGHLIVPAATIEGSKLFLNKVSSDNGSIYGYDKPTASVRPATTAVGLLCRMYTGWDRSHPGIQKGVKHLAKAGVRKNDLYYDYYAAQVLRQNGGPAWDKFNVELRDYLVSTQNQDSGAKGSWYVKGPHMDGPGRLCTTSFATMILEVYYRHMPLYADSAAEDDFPL